MSWFERHPQRTIVCVILFIWVLCDTLCGFILIPKSPALIRCPHYYYHHGLLPMKDVMYKHSYNQYRFVTNSLGMRDKERRVVPLETKKKRIVFIGDSFTEGVEVPYENTFIGYLTNAVAEKGYDILNAGVIGYAPTLYYLRTKYLLENIGLHFDELFVFIDISDIQNEIAYENFRPAPLPYSRRIVFGLHAFLKESSYVYYAINNRMSNNASRIKEYNPAGLFPCYADIDQGVLKDNDFDKALSAWTFDERIYEKYGKRGLALAIENMRRLTDLTSRHKIKVTIVVYPWPLQIKMQDLNSRQVQAWREFALRNNVGFIDLFPQFINAADDPRETVETFYLVDKIHWNAAGHKRVADYLKPYIISGQDGLKGS